MCGIVGVVGRGDAAPLILDALKRLEYRGYDSAGIATLTATGRVERRRAAGKLRNLEAVLGERPLPGRTGIGHTRWATHGAPTETNAHPHVANRVAVVHNGIIENFRALKAELAEAGHRFESETDTEVVAHVLGRAIEAGHDLSHALKLTVESLEGAYALAFLVEGDPDRIAVARSGSPLAVGFGEDGHAMFVGSDAIALAPFTDRIVYLEEGDFGIVSPGRLELWDRAGRRANRAVRPTPARVSLAEKGNFRHFMAKEIHEQPVVIAHTLAHYADLGGGRLRPDAMAGLDLSGISRIAIVACGTAYYAGLVGRYFIERLARIPVDVEIASEFRYREAPLSRDQLALVISQSGETADTLASLRHCKEAGLATAGIVNVDTSTVAREVDTLLPTLAGPEIGVASTKAFTCQLATLAVLAIRAGRDRGVLSAADETELVRTLAELPRLMSDILVMEARIERITRTIATARHALYLGRGAAWPIALEGALKLKEISYIHAEGYAAGELKHGPIALVDEEMPVIVIAPHDELFEKTQSNMQEVAARGGRILLITDERGAAAAADAAAETIVLPDAPPLLAPLLFALPVQLLAYHAAVINGTDVDQPRNLAKSVTVE